MSPGTASSAASTSARAQAASAAPNASASGGARDPVVGNLTQRRDRTLAWRDDGVDDDRAHAHVKRAKAFEIALRLGDHDRFVARHENRGEGSFVGERRPEAIKALAHLVE